MSRNYEVLFGLITAFGAFVFIHRNPHFCGTRLYFIDMGFEIGFHVGQILTSVQIDSLG
jgi:hypothetical protein